MSDGNSNLRSELDRKFQPPLDVLLDPSLFVSKYSLKRLDDSPIFTSQTQATLGRTPTKPRLGDLYVPATFNELVEEKDQSTVQKTDVWDFYRGQAEAAFGDDIVDILHQNDVNEFSAEEASDDLLWTNAIDGPNRQKQLQTILNEELSFLKSGGILLSRTSAALKAFRDGGIATINVGRAELAPELRETLTDIGYRNPANICSFGVSTAESTANALTGNILSHNSKQLIYQLGE